MSDQQATPSGKGILRVSRKNGDIYIYQRVTEYNPKKGYTEAKNYKLLGKLVQGKEPMVPTRPRAKKDRTEAKPPVSATRKHTGQADIFDWLEKQTHIAGDLQGSFDAGVSQKIRTIARYWTANPGATLPRIETWQLQHPAPYAEGISQDTYHRLFEELGGNESGIQSYFYKRADRCPKGGSLAFDSTTISTYGEGQTEARYGFNKDGDGLPALKLLTLYSIENHEPIAFTKQPGNLTDVASVTNALKQLSVFDTVAPMVVTDAGYWSEENLLAFSRNHVKFLSKARTNISWIRKLIDENQEALNSIKAVNLDFLPVEGICVPVKKEFTWSRQRSRGEKAAGASESKEFRLYVYIYRNSDTPAADQTAFLRRIHELRKQIIDGEQELSEAAQKEADRFFTISRKGRGGKVKVELKAEAYAQAKKYFGYFVLVSNKSMETFEALQTYRKREKIEEAFCILKNDLDSKKPRTWHPDNLRGRQFCQFIALSYNCFLHWKLAELKNKLESMVNAKGAEEKFKGRIKALSKLLTWVKSTSVAEILEWFDCTEETTIRSNCGQKRWTTEMTERDELFLTMLGVIKPNEKNKWLLEEGRDSSE